MSEPNIENNDLMRRVVVSSSSGRLYTYETDLDVSEGDRVLLPPGTSDNPWEGTVTSFASKYTGPCKQIIEVIDDD
jgi:hypothetical protein